MTPHEKRCPHCRAKAGLDAGTVPVVDPITVPELPEAPRVFRIHYPAGHARDYILHPDGRLTFAIAGQVLTTSLSFADMAGMSWEGAHIEWDPEPFADEPNPEPGPVAEAVQDSIPLAA
ncbi:hypothetical protein [Streptomyces sp. PU_AKi4]|uniref:hypothetical protein n=1 Tax=Streptomyces sp. PU_AKi4 TaxID=2800809 RepID=UPI003524529F